MRAQTGITKRDLVHYALLPGIWPRTLELFAKGFPYLSYLLASVFAMVRLLPPRHPALSPGTAGQYGLVQIISIAAGELSFSWKNTDKIAVFFAILSGMVMLAIQFVLMVVALIVTPANAQTALPTTYEGFFQTQYPKDDIAFKMLDLVFGIPGFFALEESGAEPFHLALQALFQFYSFGLLLVGIFLLVYIVIVIVAETAQSGTPFGQRYNHAWAPIRLILFFGLLIPISNGLNGAQYMVLFAAKGGSGLATNGWVYFNKTLTESPMGEKGSLIAKPRPPDMTGIPAFIMLAKTCRMAVGFKQSKDVKAWVIVNNKAEELGSKTYQSIVDDLKNAKSSSFDVKVRFGEKDDRHTNQPGTVYPYCGEMFFYTSDISEPGSAVIQQAYYEMVQKLWDGPPKGGISGPPGGKKGMIEMIGSDLNTYAENFFKRYILNEDAKLPPPNFRALWTDQLIHYMSGDPYQFNGAKYPEDKSGGRIGDAVKKQIKDGDLGLEEEILRMGWGGAAIWYNKIAEQNGAISASVSNIPTPSLYPEVMEYVSKQKSRTDRFLTDVERFNPSLKDGSFINMRLPGEEAVSGVLNKVFMYWQDPNAPAGAISAKRAPTDNIFVDAINLFFGTSGLFDMCHNKDVHPLAQLSAVGKGMIDHSIRGFALGAGMGIGSNLLGILSPYLGQAGFAATSFMMTVAGIGLMLGFILFYLLPFLPFMYFFFAAGAWLKGIFEAMVGAPLWALGHLRIDGEGIVGEAATGGYFMVLEILIRPILTVFGLLASLIIFGAMVRVLNDIFYLVVSNLPAGQEGAAYCFTGEEAKSFSYLRGPIDELFYTIVYAIVVYMIGMSSFKLIDGIPKSIMRWLGEDVAAFGDQAGDAAEGLLQRVAISGAGLGEKLEGGLKQTGSGLGSAVNSLMGR